MNEVNCSESELSALLCVLGSELDYIFDNTESFMKAFSRVDYWELVAVYFSDTKIKIHYILDCGQHVSDEKEIADYLDWRNT